MVSAEQKFTSRLILTYFQPSALGIVFWIFTSLLILASVLLPRFYSESGLQALFFEAGSIGNNSVILRYQLLSDQLQNSQLVATAGVFLFWAMVGLVIHYIVSGFVKAASDAKEIKETLGYVHIKKSDVYRAVIVRSIIRIIAVVLFVVALNIFRQFALPYALAAATNIDLLNPRSAPYAIIAVGVLMLSLYILTILMRWILLRPRIIGDPPLEPEIH